MIYEKIKIAREKAGLSQTEVANKLGVAQPTYFNIENGYKVPSLGVATQLAMLFGVSLDYLVGITDKQD